MADRTPRRLASAGSPLVRALAAWSDVDAPAVADAFALRLAGWVDWRHAVSLAATLDEPPASRPAAATASDLQAAEAHARERARVHKALARRVTEAVASADAATWRSRYTACQQAMESRIGPLRARLRTALAAGPAGLARLAELDAVMEGIVAPREQALLAAVAGRLEARRTALHGGSDEPPPSIAPFRADIQTLLLAELDLRLQPVDALLDALRSGE